MSDGAEDRIARVCLPIKRKRLLAVYVACYIRNILSNETTDVLRLSNTASYSPRLVKGIRFGIHAANILR